MPPLYGTRPILEYVSTILSPITSTTNIIKLQTIQHTALRIGTGCTLDTVQLLNDKTNIKLPLHTLETLYCRYILLSSKAQSTTSHSTLQSLTKHNNYSTFQSLTDHNTPLNTSISYRAQHPTQHFNL